MQAPKRLWPVVVRPLQGELLYSWLARVAGVYDLEPIDLLRECSDSTCLDVLVNGSDLPSLRRLSARTRVRNAKLWKMTLQGNRAAWPERWRIGACHAFSSHVEPVLQVCPECLKADIACEGGAQFLRIRWQSAALTICSKHRTPLQQACVVCRYPSWPVSRRGLARQFRFLCTRCGSPQDQNSWGTEPPDDCSVNLLIRFERQIVRALANKPVSWNWVGHAEPTEFVHLIEDLLWILPISCRKSRPIYKLQTLAFPLGEQCFPAPADGRWYAGPPHVRRCLLAAALAIIGSGQTRALLQGPGTHPLRWCELVDRLDTETRVQLERRSWLWPVAAHNALRRALLQVRDKPSMRSSRRKRRRFSTD
jgi:hypothetical protein